jgi:hypothetical protein
MTKGVLVFARNNVKVDYIKQAYFLAKRVRKYLDIPTSIVTDSVQYLLSEYSDARKVFDKIIPVDTSINENHGTRKYWDGSLVNNRLEFKNNSRPYAYDLSPYEETLLLDTDIIICNNIYKQCFSQAQNFLIYKRAVDLSGIDRGQEFERISDSSADFYWATAVFFRKTPENKIFFDLTKHVMENWQHYKNVFQMDLPYYRNDHCFSVAIHIMNGYQQADFANPMPGTLYYTTDKSLLWDIDNDNLFFLLEKHKYAGEYVPLKIKNANVHVMNKFSLNRCIDEH